MPPGDDDQGQGHVLPPPATTRQTSGKSKKSKGSKEGKRSLRRTLAGGSGPTKRATFSDDETHKKPLRVHWTNLLKVISTAVSLSDSPLDPTVESTEASSYRANIQRRESDWGTGEDDPSVPPPEVNEVVVNAEWDLDKWADASTAGISESMTGGVVLPQSHASRALGSQPDGRSQAGFTNPANSSGIREIWGLTTVLRWRLYPRIVRFFDLSFYSAYQEEKYRKDVWFTQKRLAAFTACFYLFIVILNSSLSAIPFTMYNMITTVGGGLLFDIPVLICVLFNLPRMKLKYQWPYQLLLMVATWQWGWYNLFDAWNCGFFSVPGHPACGTKDFQLTSFYSTAIPFLALFALGQNRFFATLAMVAYEVLGLVLVLPDYAPWGRNFANTLVWHLLMLYVHFTLETAERRSFTLREQLKDQCKATQKAQVNERKESDSKKRFVSYIFHEVRVPLNTALLASQNLVGSGMINKDEDMEFQALEGSLKMMSKVLNDVLDFNRMDSGRFVTVSKPYCFHGAIRSMLLPLELSARSRGLHLSMKLDPRIDELANRASYGSGEELEANGGKEGWVLGDEMRLRQLVTNLTSNACKFTSEGGRVHLETKLIFPQMGDTPTPLPALLEEDPEHPVEGHEQPSTQRHNDDQSPPQLSPDPEHGLIAKPNQGPPSRGGLSSGTPLYTPMSGRSINNGRTPTSSPQKTGMVVRIEVQDTGVGIKPRDLIDNRLFSPYVQTEIGRFQGGKGTGLGLALVRNIVKLSGGRLGVKSKVGQGSTFWVELALGIGPHALKGKSEKHYNSRVPRWPHNTSNAVTSIDFAKADIARPDTPLMGPDEDPIEYLAGMHESSLDPLTGQVVLSEFHAVKETNMPSHPLKQEESESAAVVQQSMCQSVDGPALLTGSVPGDLNKIVSEPQKTSPIPVLVVDDDLLTRKLMARMLSRIGCNVELAENGQVALDCLIGPGAHTQAVTGRRLPSSTSTLLTPGSELSSEPIMVDEHKYAVVFLDNQMPLYSGVQVVEHLRTLGRTTYVVGVTGNALKEDQQEYLEAGVDKILTKPVLEKDLRSVVAVARERWRHGGEQS